MKLPVLKSVVRFRYKVPKLATLVAITAVKFYLTLVIVLETINA